ncbi:unnamed protein product, partial [Rotaria sp. Silwood1]
APKTPEHVPAPVVPKPKVKPFDASHQLKGESLPKSGM